MFSARIWKSKKGSLKLDPNNIRPGELVYLDFYRAIKKTYI